MEIPDIVQDKKTKTFLLVTRVLASIIALFFIMALGPKIVGEVIDAFHGEPLYDGWEGFVMELAFIAFITGYIFSWWKVCTGGMIIILASIVQMTPFLIIDGNFGSLIFGIPMLVVGVLFLLICKNRDK